MKINLEPVFNTVGFSIPLSYVLNYREDTMFPGIFQEPLPVTGEICNESGVVYFRAVITGTLFLVCDRCAKAFERSLHIPLEHILVITVNEEETDEMLLLPSMQLDLDELLREDLLLHLPGKFLCRAECKGLCPRCGRDLNEGPCSCEKQVDPRLAALQQLLEDQSDS